MSDPREQEINALRTLLTTAVDGQKGYSKALEACTDASEHFRNYLQSSKDECQRAAGEIRTMLLARGEEVGDEDGSIGGALHRGWIEARAAFSSHDEEVYAAEIVRGEEHAVKQYEKALEDISTHSCRGAISDQLAALRDNLTKARAFCKQLAN